MKYELISAIGIIIMALLTGVIALLVGADDVSGAKCGNMKWGDTDHKDNIPKSIHKLAYIDNLCELAKKIDHEQASSHDAVKWDKFQNSPAFINAEKAQQDCLTKAHKDGHGMNGLGGYEILYCAIDED